MRVENLGVDIPRHVRKSSGSKVLHAGHLIFIRLCFILFFLFYVQRKRMMTRTILDATFSILSRITSLFDLFRQHLPLFPTSKFFLKCVYFSARHVARSTRLLNLPLI